jgi:energy-coupling factor transport system permease protein
VVGGEDITDAMDLRAFGVGPRTWLPQLKYRAMDWVYMAFGVLLLAATIVLKRAGLGGLWVPPFLLS